TPLRGWNAFEIEFAHVGRQETIQQHLERTLGQSTFGALDDDKRADLRRFIDEVVEFHLKRPRTLRSARCSDSLSALRAENSPALPRATTRTGPPLRRHSRWDAIPARESFR